MIVLRTKNFGFFDATGKVKKAFTSGAGKKRFERWKEFILDKYKRCLKLSEKLTEEEKLQILIDQDKSRDFDVRLIKGAMKNPEFVEALKKRSKENKKNLERLEEIRAKLKEPNLSEKDINLLEEEQIELENKLDLYDSFRNGDMRGGLLTNMRKTSPFLSRENGLGWSTTTPGMRSDESGLLIDLDLLEEFRQKKQIKRLEENINNLKTELANTVEEKNQHISQLQSTLLRKNWEITENKVKQESLISSEKLNNDIIKNKEIRIKNLENELDKATKTSEHYWDLYNKEEKENTALKVAAGGGISLGVLGAGYGIYESRNKNKNKNKK